MPAAVQKFYYPLDQFEADVEKIAQAVKSGDRKFTHVYGLPRGGLPLAVWLSHRLALKLADGRTDFLSGKMIVPKLVEIEPGVSLVQTVSASQVIVVDDIADTGTQLQRYRDSGYFIATLFYHRQSTVVPDIWLHEKFEKWIVFPWEKEELV